MAQDERNYRLEYRTKPPVENISSEGRTRRAEKRVLTGDRRPSLVRTFTTGSRRVTAMTNTRPERVATANKPMPPRPAKRPVATTRPTTRATTRTRTPSRGRR